MARREKASIAACVFIGVVTVVIVVHLPGFSSSRPATPDAVRRLDIAPTEVTPNPEIDDAGAPLDIGWVDNATEPVGAADPQPKPLPPKSPTRLAMLISSPLGLGASMAAEVLAKEGNEPSITDELWETALRQGKIVDIKNNKELALRLILHHKQEASVEALEMEVELYGFAKIVYNEGGEEWPREILTYAFDRLAGFYLTPPAVHRNFDFPAIASSFPEGHHVRERVEELRGFAASSSRRMKTQPRIDKPVDACVIGWLNYTIMEIRDVDELDPRTLGDRDQRGLVEYRMLQYLTSCPKLLRSHFYTSVGLHWVMIDNDRCFRERRLPMTVPKQLTSLCRFPRDIAAFLRVNRDKIGDLLWDKLKGSEAAVVQAWVQRRIFADGSNIGGRPFQNLLDRTGKLLDAVDECIKQNGEINVYYDRGMARGRAAGEARHLTAKLGIDRKPRPVDKRQRMF